MKQCKICGTIVHIDFNTCPSCGSHSFFVVDVRICPLCGKVNSLTSSFCEQCGKQFVNNQGGKQFVNNQGGKQFVNNQGGKQFVNNQGGVNIEKNSVNKTPFYNNKEIQSNNELKDNESKYGNNDFEIEKPIIKSSNSTLAKENIADKVYKDFIELRPDIIEKDDHLEYSYYVKGDANKLPMVILPKFVKASGKNIIVNIVVQKEETAVQKTENIKIETAVQKTENIKIETAVQKAENIKIETAVQKTVVKTNDDNGEFKPFSAIEENKAVKFDENSKINNFDENSKINNIDKILENPDLNLETKDEENGKLKEKLLKDLNIKSEKKPKKAKEKIKINSVITSIILIFIAFCALTCFTMVFYTSEDAACKTAGLSPVIFLLNSIFKTDISLPFAYNNGYVAYMAASRNGQLLNLDYLFNLDYIVPSIFTIAAILMIAAIIINICTLSQKVWAKIVLVWISIITLVCEFAMILDIFFVFNSGISTLGVGLILTVIMTIIYLITLLIAYKPEKKD